MSVWKYKIMLKEPSDVRRVLIPLFNAGYILTSEIRIGKLDEQIFIALVGLLNADGNEFDCITYNNGGCPCKRVFELAGATECHIEISIEDFLKLNLINS